MKYSLILVLVLMATFSSCRESGWKNVSDGQITILSSPNSPFPHPDRSVGHTYHDSLYSFEEHYNDSSVAIFVPESFVKADSVDLVFYFHGWYNNIHKSLEQFRLIEQFANSGKNAILVFPEGPKNAPDSFGGKLEQTGMFKSLVEEVLEELQEHKMISASVPGDIILSGHSGAYRVISAILNRGGLSANVSEVYLFDALYGQVENYTHWLDQYSGRFVNIVTPDGGTYYNSLDLMQDFQDWGIPATKYEQNQITVEELKQDNIITIYTSLGHSDVIDPFFEILLKSSQ